MHSKCCFNMVSNVTKCYRMLCHCCCCCCWTILEATTCNSNVTSRYSCSAVSSPHPTLSLYLCIYFESAPWKLCDKYSFPIRCTERLLNFWIHTAGMTYVFMVHHFVCVVFVERRLLRFSSFTHTHTHSHTNAREEISVRVCVATFVCLRKQVKSWFSWVWLQVSASVYEMQVPQTIALLLSLHLSIHRNELDDFFCDWLCLWTFLQLK